MDPARSSVAAGDGGRASTASAVRPPGGSCGSLQEGGAGPGVVVCPQALISAGYGRSCKWAAQPIWRYYA